MTPKSSYRRSRLAPRLIKAIVEAKVGELQETLFENTPQKDNLQRSIVNGIFFVVFLLFFYYVKKQKKNNKKEKKSNNERSTTRE